MNSLFGILGGKPIGSLKCEKTWQANATIKNCKAKLEDLSGKELIEAMQVLTSNPKVVDADDVTRTLKIFSEIASQTTDPNEVGMKAIWLFENFNCNRSRPRREASSTFSLLSLKCQSKSLNASFFG